MPAAFSFRHSCDAQGSLVERDYEQALRAIGLVDRDDPIAEMVAKKIIEIGQTGVREPADISALAIKGLGVQ